MSSIEADELATYSDDWRDRILSDPDLILDDRDLMRALITANDRQMGGNIVDMRGIAMGSWKTGWTVWKTPTDPSSRRPMKTWRGPTRSTGRSRPAGPDRVHRLSQDAGQ